MTSDFRDIIKTAWNETVKTYPFELTEDDAERAVAIGLPVMKLVQGLKKPRLLDIGSGAMALTSVFARCGFHCCAVDDLSDPWHLGKGVRERVQEFARLMGIEFHLQDATYHIPFEKASFDIVMLNSVIEHLHESPQKLLDEAMGFLKEGGLLVITMPNSVNLRKRLAVLCGRTNYPAIQVFHGWEGPWRGHVREYTRRETEYIVRVAGGEILLSATIHQAMRRVPYLFRPFYRILTACLPNLRDSLMVVARRPSGWRPREPQ